MPFLLRTELDDKTVYKLNKLKKKLSINNTAELIKFLITQEYMRK